MKTLLTNNRRTSKTLVSRVEEVPEISAMVVEFTPNKQRRDAFFSDVMHRVTTSGGKVPVTQTRKEGTKVKVGMKREDSQKGVQWLSNLNTDETRVNVKSADETSSGRTGDALRTYLASSLENDLKYRLGVKEVYRDRVKLRVTVVGNQTSNKQVRAREALLRINYLPLREVKRRVK